MHQGAHKKIEKIFSSALKPLSRILIKNGFLLNSSVELLKRVFVEVAVEDGAETDSLVSLRTGVHRKDVKRLREATDDSVTEKSPIKGLALVMSVWSNDPRFSSTAGKPLVLYRAPEAGRACFDDLVRASKVDMAPATVLEELVDQSLVTVHDDGRIGLLSTAFVARSGDAALKAFEATVTDHLRIAADNVLSMPGAPRQFDQVVRYSHLSEDSVRALEDEARKLGRAYLEHMNAMAHRLQSKDDASGQLANGRFVAGVFIAPTLSDTNADAGAGIPSSRKDQNT